MKFGAQRGAPSSFKALKLHVDGNLAPNGESQSISYVFFILSILESQMLEETPSKDLYKKDLNKNKEQIR